MSLLVHAFIYDENKEMQFIEKDRSDELAGFESCRKKFYGNAISKALDLKILPTLAVESNLFVCFDDLQDLKEEVELMLNNLNLYEQEKIYKRDYMEQD
jgi:hypothetical protein